MMRLSRRRGKAIMVVRKRKDTQGGFTLIELMIVVVVIAILAAIAIPNYTNYVRQSHRADAQSEMLRLAQALERCFTRHRSYEGASCPIPTAEPPPIADTARYNFGFVSTATTFTITADPIEGSGQDRGTCGVLLELTHIGERNPGDCWN